MIKGITNRYYLPIPSKPIIFPYKINVKTKINIFVEFCNRLSYLRIFPDKYELSNRKASLQFICKKNTKLLQNKKNIAFHKWKATKKEKTHALFSKTKKRVLLFTILSDGPKLPKALRQKGSEELNTESFYSLFKSHSTN